MDVGRIISSSYILTQRNDSEVNAILNELSPSERKLFAQIISLTEQQRTDYKENPKTERLAGKLENLTNKLEKKDRNPLKNLANRIINYQQGTTKKKILSDIRNLPPPPPPKEEIKVKLISKHPVPIDKSPSNIKSPTGNPVRDFENFIKDPTTVFKPPAPKKKRADDS